MLMTIYNIIISVTQCPVVIPSNLINPPSVTKLDPVTYKGFLNFTCNIPGQGVLMKSRQCLYDRKSDEYSLFGDPYECGGL